MPLSRPLSLYFHIPFCAHRCAYCDFNTYAGQEQMIPGYVEALCKEIEFVGSRLPSPIRAEQTLGVGEVEVEAGGEAAHTIFFGGGTPSLLSPKQFQTILESIHANFPLTDDLEITIEANPGTV